MKKIFMLQIDSLEDHGPDKEIMPIVHYAGCFEDRTLCGTAYEEDDRYPHEYATPTNKRVTCDLCIMIRDYVRGK